MMKGLLVAAAALMLLPGAAAAQNLPDNMYGELRGGASFPDDADTDFGGGIDGDLSSDTGWLIEGAFGYAHESGLRGEIVGGYRYNDLDDFKISGGTVDIEGDIEAVTVMVNLYYDFDLGTYGGATGATANLVPFVGGGIGAAFLNAEIDQIGGIPINDEEDDTVFAWQVVTGLAYNFTPKLAATLRYAYFATSDPEFDGVDSEYSGHNVLGGIRYSF
jgi:opacity protein-like surface antigen